jgi:hypothetical protein
MVEPRGSQVVPQRLIRPLFASVARALTARHGALLLALLGATGFAATMVLFYPGFVSADSAVQLEQARTGALTDHHPILMAVIWRGVDKLVPGPGGMLVLINGLHWAALSVIFWALGGPLLARAAGLVLLGTFLPSVCCLTAIWKDPFMHAALLAALACILVPTRRRPWLRHGLAAVLFLVALGVRQNGLAAVWPLVALLIVELRPLVERPRWARMLLAGGLAAALTTVVTVALTSLLGRVGRAEHFWQEIAAFDLVSISLNADTLVIDPETHLLAPGVGLPQLRMQFRPDYHNNLYLCAVFRPDRCISPLNHLSNEVFLSRLAHNWLRAVLAHPGAYLAHRADMAARILRTMPVKPARYYYLETAPHHPYERIYRPPPRTLRLLAWMDLQQTWIGFAPWIYVLVSVCLLPVTLVRSLRGAPLLPLVLVVSGLSYLLSVLLAAGGPDNRYTVWTQLCTMLAVMTIFLPPREAR